MRYRYSFANVVLFDNLCYMNILVLLCSACILRDSTHGKRGMLNLLCFFCQTLYSGLQELKRLAMHHSFHVFTHSNVKHIYPT